MSISTYSELQTAIINWAHREDDTPFADRVPEFIVLSFKELRYVGETNYTLQPKPLEWIRAQVSDTAGSPRYFAVTGSQVVCWPEAGSIQGTYYEVIPDLATNSTNWLLTRHPDLYLFASLVEAALYMQDDSRIPLWAEKASALLDAVQRSDDKDQFDGGILAIRAR
jgi:hypothetical protein